jgi:hypothetical protein
MTATLKERQRIVALVHASIANGSSTKEAALAIHLELPHLTAAEVSEVCGVNAEERRLDAAVLKAEAGACHFIATTLEAMGWVNLREAFEELLLRAEAGEEGADELLEQLIQAHALVGDWIDAKASK